MCEETSAGMAQAHNSITSSGCKSAESALYGRLNDIRWVSYKVYGNRKKVHYVFSIINGKLVYSLKEAAD